MDLVEKQSALKKCVVLTTVEDADLQWLADAARIEPFIADQVVFLEGDNSTRVYIVAQGSFHVRLGEADKLVSLAETGTLFGEYAMFVKGVRTANVIAKEPSTLLSFSGEQFREFLLRCPTVMMQLLETAARRLHRVERKRG